jgi:hypothetical protein
MPATDGPGAKENDPRPDPETETLAQSVVILPEQLALANAGADPAETRNDAKDATIAHLRLSSLRSVIDELFLTDSRLPLFAQGITDPALIGRTVCAQPTFDQTELPDREGRGAEI